MSNPVSAPQAPKPTAPTPVNTPLDSAPIQRESMSRPSVPTVGEEEQEEEDVTLDVNSMANNPALMGMVQGKLNHLIGKSSGYIETLPPAVRGRLSALHSVQRDHTALEKQYQTEILLLERKFLGLYTPLYERRREIVTGAAEPTEDEVSKGKAIEAEDDEDDEHSHHAHAGHGAAHPHGAGHPHHADSKSSVTEIRESADSAEGMKGIPEFWLTALKNHGVFAERITDRDEEALKYLQDIKLSYIPDGTSADASGQPGFSIHFTFAPNKFFSDSEIKKSYFYKEEVGYSGDMIYDRAEGQDIAWKSEGSGDDAISFDLTKKVEVKKQRNKTTNRTRVIKKIVPAESFFNFFYPPRAPADDESLDEEMAEELADLDEKLELDYQLGEDLKERVIPRAVDFFTGKALEYEQGMDSEEDYDDDLYDEDDEDDDEDGDESHAQQTTSAKKEGSSSFPAN